ncbi:hypothetical protein CC1G_13890 [Coprinopsis cinerea okayama7|uniref:Thioredoxin domain-containing protein n=1 Tax=Coprinopsis cinerea (strain Okayama-7 / 130 / ATCC MYA-4618 / FGSC 9003) TaxID=240176 RepID=D6RKM4_COPC7|nr:hypothetical protein CC1G_13890 [Coprinopsis cinerea okayama7\|eukprot:XP_002911850.1 hypothetical protein CC1G_13890 [Coprinopsis cinerea okayama7\
MSASSLFRSLRPASSLTTRSLWSGRLNGAVGYARSFHTTRPCAALYLNVDNATFDKVTSVKDRVVLVDFYADWCGPCRQLSPVIEKLTQEPATSGSGLPIDLVKVDTDSTEGQALGRKYRVTALPTVLAFKNGEVADGFLGAQPEAKIKQFIESL